MNVLKIETSEVVYSAFLAWLLDPRENHGLGTYFLKYFLMMSAKISKTFNVIDIDNLNLSNAIVRTEENFHGTRADITIRIDNAKVRNFGCIIENKVKSSEGEGQTKNYVKYSNIKYPDYDFMYVYLTPFGEDADSKEFISLDYESIRILLDQTVSANKENMNEEILNLIQDFLNNLEVNILNKGKITELCKIIYEKHKEAIEIIIANKPQHIKIIRKELRGILNDEWETHPTKTDCYVFKREWLEDFKEYSVGSLVPFFFYNVHSWNMESMYIAVQLYIDRTKEWKYDIRELFTTILEDLIDKSDIKPFHYNKQNIAKKIKEVIIKEGYENEEDLRFVAHEMFSLIGKTGDILDKAVDILKSKLK